MRFSEKIIAISILFAALFTLTACDTDKIPSQASSSIPSTYTVSFNSQFIDLESDTTPPDVTTKTVTSPATTIDALPTDPVMSGYKFGGWWTGKGGLGASFTANTKVYGDRTVYAYWYNYQVIFENDGETYASRGITLPANTVSSLPSAPTKSGFSFAGWWTGGGCTGEEFTISSIVDDSNTVNGALTVYACWSSEETRVITFWDGQTVMAKQHVTGPEYTLEDSGSDVPEPETPCREFQGWWTQQNGGGTQFFKDTPVPSAEIDVYAKWSSDTVHTIIYNSGRGSAVATQCVTGSDLVNFSDFTLDTNSKSLPPNPSKRCYAFAGWWTGQYGTGESFNANTIVDGNKRDEEGNLIDGDTQTPETEPVYEGKITVYANWTWTGGAEPSPYSIGDYGPSCVGKVFYVTDGGLHGLEMAPPGWYNWYAENPDPSFSWIDGDPVVDDYGYEYQIIQQTRNGNTLTEIGTGMANSQAIMAQDGAGGTEDKDYAAKISINYNGGGFDDWFLPSKDELQQLFANRDVKRPGGFADLRYWSSSEYELGTFDGWSQNFTNGKQHGTYKASELNVRPVRAF
jgi:uncharacterized repeat protein (TIGR02543 family)